MASFTPKSEKNLASSATGIAIRAKPTRVIKTPHQLKVLEDSFSLDANPSREAKVELGLQLGLTPRQIQIWFCDRRRRGKKRNMDNTQRNGGLQVIGEKEKMGDDEDKHVSGASSSSRSDSGSRSSHLVVKLKVPRAMLGASVNKLGSPMATQWDKMPNIIEACDEPRSSGHKRKITVPDECRSIQTEKSALKRVRCENEASRIENKGLSEEAIRIFRELRKEAQRRKELEQCGRETQKKEAEWRKPPSMMRQNPIGAPSATGSHGKGDVAYAYCADTGQCFIITRRNPAMCPPRPVTHEDDPKKSDPEEAVVEEKCIRTKLEIQDIQKRNWRETQRAINQGLRNFLQKRMLPLGTAMT